MPEVVLMNPDDERRGLICGPFDMIHGPTEEQIAADAERMREAGRKAAIEANRRFWKAFLGKEPTDGN